MKQHKKAKPAPTNKPAELNITGALFNKEPEPVVAPSQTPTTKQAAPVTPKANTETFLKIDKQDHEQIIERENTGQIISNVLFYEAERTEIDSKGEKKIIVGFRPSYAGVLRCMQVQGNLDVVGNPMPEHTSGKYIYTVQVKDTLKNISIYGQGFCDKTDIVTRMLNPYAQAIALSVALRNAYEKLLYPDIKKQVLDEWYEANHGGKEKDMSQIVIVSGDADIKKYL